MTLTLLLKVGGGVTGAFVVVVVVVVALLLLITVGVKVVSSVSIAPAAPSSVHGVGMAVVGTCVFGIAEEGVSVLTIDAVGTKVGAQVKGDAVVGSKVMVGSSAVLGVSVALGALVGDKVTTCLS